VITSWKSSSGKAWTSITVVQDPSKVFNPDVVVASKDRALLYAALNFREPAHLSKITIRASTGTRTDLGHLQHFLQKRLPSPTKVS
jgi:hypothetical protein